MSKSPLSTVGTSAHSFSPAFVFEQLQYIVLTWKASEATFRRVHPWIKTWLLELKKYVFIDNNMYLQHVGYTEV